MVWIGGTSCDSTWEMCSSLPKQLVDEFEDGVRRELIDSTFSSGGETVHTLSSVPVSHHLAKKQRVEVSSAPCEGYIKFFDLLLALNSTCMHCCSCRSFSTIADDSPVVKCNTTKDRVKLNYSTAGK